MTGAPVLVTGGTGFIGGHLVDRLLAEGCAVTLLARPGAAIPARWQQRVEVLRLTGMDYAAMIDLVGSRRFSVIYHLAAAGVLPQDRNIETLLAVNTLWPVALVRLAAATGARLVVTGSSAEYAPASDGTLLVETAPLETERLYGATKAAGGLATLAAAHSLGVPVAYLRLFNVYGPGEAAHRLLPSLVSQLARETPVALSDGLQIRDFIHVGDVVEALWQAGTGEARTAAFNISTGTGHSVRDFACAVARALGRPESLLRFGALPRRPDDLAWLVGDNARARASLSFQPRFDFASGIDCAIAALRSDKGEE
mgnify:CR=1 FL=1